MKSLYKAGLYFSVYMAIANIVITQLISPRQLSWHNLTVLFLGSLLTGAAAGIIFVVLAGRLKKN